MSWTRGVLLVALSVVLTVAMWFAVPCEDFGVVTRASHILSVSALATLCMVPLVYRLLPGSWRGPAALAGLLGPTLALWLAKPLFVWQPAILCLAVPLAMALAAAPPRIGKPTSFGPRLCWFLLVALTSFLLYYFLATSLLPLDATRILASSTRRALNTCLRQAPYLAVVASNNALAATEVVGLVPLALFAATRAGSRFAAPGVERYLLLLFPLAYLIYESPLSPIELAVHITSIAVQLVVLSSSREARVGAQQLVAV